LGILQKRRWFCAVTPIALVEVKRGGHRSLRGDQLRHGWISHLQLYLERVRLQRDVIGRRRSIPCQIREESVITDRKPGAQGCVPDVTFLFLATPRAIWCGDVPGTWENVWITRISRIRCLPLCDRRQPDVDVTIGAFILIVGPTAGIIQQNGFDSEIAFSRCSTPWPPIRTDVARFPLRSIDSGGRAPATETIPVRIPAALTEPPAIADGEIYAPKPPPIDNGDDDSIGGPGTPVSLTFLGSLYSDAALLAFASAFQRESCFHILQPPGFG
jgi:hypothetical protein